MISKILLLIFLTIFVYSAPSADRMTKVPVNHIIVRDMVKITIQVYTQVIWI